VLNGQDVGAEESGKALPSAPAGQQLGDDLLDLGKWAAPPGSDDLGRSSGKGAGGGNVVRRRVISLDQRKLSRKDEARLADWKGRNRGKALDAFFRGQAELARKKFGHKSVYVGSEADALIICIPMYAGHGEAAARYPGCLPMEFVLAQDGFPLGLVFQLVARHGVGKSGLLAEFGRWFFLAGGGMYLNEAESKFNPNWYRSILGKEFFDMMPLARCKSVEDWQRKLSFSIQSTKAGMEGSKESPGPGRTIPVLYGVDSIMGKSSEETQEAILGKLDRRTGQRGTTGDGAASRGFPIEALKITRYMRTIPGELDEWPFSLVLVNHLRIKTDDAGNVERSKAGGEQVNFQESFELELKKVGGHKKVITCANFEGFPVEISCEKNSFGPTHRRIQTRLLWWDEKNEDGEWEQRTAWDWDWSTVHLLYTLMHGERANPRFRQALKDIDFHLECPKTAEVENLAWSRSLGMKREDAMPWSDVGALIREDRELLDRLRCALRINRRPVLAGDYLEQLGQLARDMP
jgi:hypothetical protein